jgi:hypothetical protein
LGLTVFNCATQKDYGRSGGPYAKLKWVRECLLKIRDNALNQHVIRTPYLVDEGCYDPPHIAFPRIGAGLGGLEWEAVLEVFYEVFPVEEPMTAWIFYDYVPLLEAGPGVAKPRTASF